MKRFLLATVFCCTAAFAAEPIRVSVFTPEGELYFLGIFDVTFKPTLQFNKAYSCTVKQDFRPSLICTRDPKGKPDLGRLKADKKSDLMCSKSLMVGV